MFRLLKFVTVGSFEVRVEATKIGTFRLAALLHGLDPTAASFGYPEAQCCSSCEGSWPRICFP